MLRSLNSGVSGLKAHQTKMDVIGNNIANVNTTAFKASRVTFQDVYYQTMSGASANNGIIGGTNPRQIGYGASVGSIDVTTSNGGIQTTDRVLDLYLSGDGYFVVSDNNGTVNYTRAGNFTFDAQGALVDSNGYYINGWQPSKGTGTAEAKPINIKNINEYTNISIGPDGMITGVYSGDAEESSYEDVGSLNDLTLAGYTNIKFEGGVIKGDNTATGETGVGLYKNITIKSDGSITADNIVDGTTGVTIGNITDYVDNPADYSGFLINSDGTLSAISKGLSADGNKTFGSINDLPLNIAGYTDVTYADGKITGTDTATGLAATIYSNVKIQPDGTFTGDNSVTGVNGETIPSVSLDSLVDDKSLYSGFTLNPDGTVTGVSAQASHINDEIEVLGQIALAKFTNPAGLTQEGGVYFKESNNSGVPVITTAGNNATGNIVSGGLEMSNVDLSTEFTDMITTQRGFQANSRVITVSDQMLEELVNLKR